MVKRYATEAGSAGVRRHRHLVVSALSRVEVCGALWRKVRLGDLDAADAAMLVADFEADLAAGTLIAVALVPKVLDQAAGCLTTDNLRASDAVQLACALAVRTADPSVTEFLCFDQRLSAAAARRGFVVH